MCIFGGSFDPPHVAHVLATAWALSVLDVDQVWWVPAWRHAFGKALSPFEQRVGLCELAIRPLGDRVRVCDIEGQLGGESRTVDTLEALARSYPGVSWTLLLGSDLVAQVQSWKRWDRIEELARIEVIGRAGHDGVDAADAVTLPDVSSSRVREMLRLGERTWLSSRVPAAVLQRIAAEGLYR